MTLQSQVKAGVWLGVHSSGAGVELSELWPRLLPLWSSLRLRFFNCLEGCGGGRGGKHKMEQMMAEVPLASGFCEPQAKCPFPAPRVLVPKLTRFFGSSPGQDPDRLRDPCPDGPSSLAHLVLAKGTGQVEGPEA